MVLYAPSPKNITHIDYRAISIQGLILINMFPGIITLTYFVGDSHDFHPRPCLRGHRRRYCIQNRIELTALLERCDRWRTKAAFRGEISWGVDMLEIALVILGIYRVVVIEVQLPRTRIFLTKWKARLIGSRCDFNTYMPGAWPHQNTHFQVYTRLPSTKHLFRFEKLLLIEKISARNVLHRVVFSIHHD